MSIARPLEIVKPSKSLIIESMSCEDMAAHIRNKTALAIQQDNAMEVGFRYLQSRSGRKTTTYEVFAAGIYALLVLGKLYDNPGYIRLISLFFYMANIPPNLGNRLRYQETETACKEWLKKKLGEQEFQQIRQLAYNNNGIESLTLFLRKKDIPANEKQLKHIEIIQNGLVAFAMAFFIPEMALMLVMIELMKMLLKKMDLSPKINPHKP